LTATFREDWRTKEKHAIPVRELAQWIRENVMLTLADAVFDCEDAELVPAAGQCVTCPKRTGANTALFDDFAQDDRCMDASCFKSKVDAHIASQKQHTDGLIQITRAYYTNAKGEEMVLTRNEYTIIEPKEQDEEGESAPAEQAPCSRATTAIVVEGPGKRGEVVHVCADPECEVHGKPNYRAEQEAAERERQKVWKRQQEQQQKNRENNRRLFDAVLDRIPKTLTRDDYETLVFATIERLQYEDWDAVCERYNISTDEMREPDAAGFELRKRAQEATEPQLIRMLMELALLPSGWSDEPLEHNDPLASVARRYEVTLTPEKTPKAKSAKCEPKKKGGRKPAKAKPTRTLVAKGKAVKKTARAGGAA
jgi:ParB family chromosome partitioning protein